MSRNIELTVESFNTMVHEWISEENINRFWCSPIEIAMRMLWEAKFTLAGDWKEAIQHLVALGADLHKCYHAGILLDNIMDIVDHPFDSLDLGDQWVDTLRRSGVDVVKYLQTERTRYSLDSRSLHMFRPYLSLYEAERYLMISEETQRISWDWYVDPSGKAFEVLEEFKNFGPGVYSDYYEQCDMLELWPFIYSDWQDCARKVHLGFANLEEKRIARIFEDRMEYRQQKKDVKLARAQGVRKGQKVPGAWIG